MQEKKENFYVNLPIAWIQDYSFLLLEQTDPTKKKCQNTLGNSPFQWKYCI